MTLSEAHELQRRELISLRAKVTRLEKQADGLFPVEEKASLQRRIRHLEQVNKAENLRHEAARANWLRMENLKYELELELVATREKLAGALSEIEILKARAEKAEAEVAMLNGTAAKLQQKLNISFENSSLASSAFPFRHSIPNSRKPSGRKPGAQKGHAAHNIGRLTPTREPVYLPAPAALREDPDVHATGTFITRQVVDIRICVDVTDYVAEVLRNRKTGARLHAAFPKGVVSSVNYGPSVKSFAFLLNNYYNVPVEKTRQCIADLTNGVVRLSSGTVCNLSSQFSAATDSERRRIFSLLTHADVLYSDATVSNINGKRKAVVLCTDKEHALYQHFDHKGHEALSCTPVKDCQGTLVHDHDRTYYAYGKQHQECIAHVLRYLTGAMENEPGLSWHKKMHSLLQKMVHLTKAKDSVPGHAEIKLLREEYEEILNLAKKEYYEHPPSRYYRDGYNLFRRMDRFQAAHLYFLTHPDVDCTNNISERCLRKFKRKQKQAVVLRSDSGGRCICDALTIIETARMQGQNIFDTVESFFAGR